MVLIEIAFSNRDDIIFYFKKLFHSTCTHNTHRFSCVLLPLKSSLSFLSFLFFVCFFQSLIH